MYARRATTSYERERIRLPSFNREIIYTCFDRPSCVQRCLSSSSSIDALSVNGAVCRVRRTVRCYYADRRSVLYSVFEIFPTVFFGGGGAEKHYRRQIAKTTAVTFHPQCAPSSDYEQLRDDFARFIKR